MDDKSKFQELLFEWRDAVDGSEEKEMAWHKLHMFSDINSSDLSIKHHCAALRYSDYLATWELCELLRTRSGVEEKIIAPYDNVSIEVEGPAVVYTVTD